MSRTQSTLTFGSVKYFNFYIETNLYTPANLYPRCHFVESRAVMSAHGNPTSGSSCFWKKKKKKKKKIIIG